METVSNRWHLCQFDFRNTRPIYCMLIDIILPYNKTLEASTKETIENYGQRHHKLESGACPNTTDALQ